jgi:hypothetical protein
VTKYGDLKASVEESRKTWRDAQNELSKTSLGQLETSQEAVAKLRMKLAGGNVDVNTLRSDAFSASSIAAEQGSKVESKTARIARMEAERAAWDVAQDDRDARNTGGSMRRDRATARDVVPFQFNDNAIALEKQALADAISYRDTQKQIAASLNEQAELTLKLARAEKSRAARAQGVKAGIKSDEDWASGSTSSRDELDLMGGMFGESPKQHADRVERDQKKQAKVYEKGFGGLNKMNDDATAHLLKVQMSNGDQANEQKRLATEAGAIWKDAGLDAAEQFAGSFAKFMDSKDPKDLFKGLLSAASGILNLVLPGAGTVANIIGGFFERGGGAYGYALPQGRSGMATGNIDGMQSMLHKREVVFKEDVVDSFPGGYPQAVRVGMGFEPVPGSSPASGQTIIYASALDNRSVLDGVAGPIEKAHVRRIVTKQGQLLAAHQRKAIAVPGHN